MWFWIFLLATLFLMLLPVIPAIVELYAGTDTQPLRVIQEYDTDVTHFATGFKNYLEKNFGSFFAAARTSEFAFQEGVLRDGTNFQVVKTGGAPSFSHKEVTKANTDKLILAFSPLVLPEKMFFETEVYSYSTIKTGGFSHFRAIMAEESLDIGERSSVLRWAHSGTVLSVGPACNLFGRASATQMIQIADNCVFERLNAPQIVFGNATLPAPLSNPQLRAINDLPNVRDIYEKRWVIGGSADLPENSLFDGDLITTKDLEIGDGSHITGSLKSNKDMHIGAGVRIDGAVFAAGNLYIEAGCQITGPVVAEGTLMIEARTVIGSPAAQTTVSANKMIISSGVISHGSIWADESAVVASPEKGRA